MEWNEMIVEKSADGSGAHIQRAPGEIFRSTSPHEAVTLDFSADGQLIAVEVLAVPIYAEGVAPQRADLAECLDGEIRIRRQS